MTDPLSDLLNSMNDDDGSSGQSSGKGLRAQLEAVLAQNKQLQEQVSRAQEAERARALSSVFEKHQIPALARDFFPKDAEPTDEAATKFVEQYGGLWGAQSATATTPPAQQAQTQAIQQFTSQAAPASLELSEDDYRAKLGEANTRAELLKMLAEMGDTVTE